LRAPKCQVYSRSRSIARAVACHWLACLAFLILGSIQIHAAEMTRVLLLHAFGRPYSPLSDMAGAFRAELVRRAATPIDLYEVSLDPDRAQDLQDAGPFVDYIRALLSRRGPDLIVAVGAPAAYFMQRHRPELFPATPMMIMGADVRRIPRATLTSNDTAVLVDLDLPAYLKNILRLLPETQKLAVVIGNSAIERFWTEEFRRGFQPFANRINIEWFNDLPFDKMLDRAASMPPRSAILWVMLSEDAAGVPYSQDRALEKIRAVSAAPIFGIGDYEIGRGIVGGPLLQTQVAGREAAELALRILKGEKPDSINPAPIVFGAPIYDWRELRRWKINEARLPPGSIVQFREPSIWEQYAWQIAAIAGVIAGQTLLISYVLFQSRRRRVAEAEAAEQRREVAHLMRVSVMGELSGAIAHEISQPLTAILSNAEAALLLLKEQSPNLSEIRDAINDIVHENNRAGKVIERLRALLKKGERKMELINLNELVQSTIALLHSELISRRIIVETRLASRVQPISGDPVQLQQVLLNLFMNAMDAMVLTPEEERHITVRTHVSPSRIVEVRIRDHGCGIGRKNQIELFKPFFTSKEHGLGLGLTISSTIAQAHGGRVTLANHEKGGAVAVFSLPGKRVLVAAE